jgi:hypothetical protein
VIDLGGDKLSKECYNYNHQLCGDFDNCPCRCHLELTHRRARAQRKEEQGGSKPRLFTAFASTRLLLPLILLLGFLIPITGATGACGNLPSSISSLIIACVPANIVNTQGVATASGFQQMFSNTPFNAMKGNVVVYNGLSGSLMPAWVENSSIVWVNLLGNTIPALGSANGIYYFGFGASSTNFFTSNNPANEIGEAPQLSGTYGQYDNGKIVFPTLYDGFWQGTLSSLWNNAGGVTVNNGLTIEGAGASRGINSANTYNIITNTVDIYAKPDTGTIDTDPLPIAWSPNSGQALNPGYNMFPDGSNHWIIQDYNGGYTTSSSFGSVSTISYQVLTGYQSSTTNYGSLNYGAAQGLASQFLAVPSGYISIDTYASGHYLYVYWIRLRTDPPADVMPTVNYGTAQSTTVTITVPSNIINYIPIILNNYQTIAVSANTPISIVYNALAHQAYESTTLNNTELFYFNGTIIPSWLEGNYLNEQQQADTLYTSNTVMFWFRSPPSNTFLPANSNTIIYLGFAGTSPTTTNNLWSLTANVGVAPQLTCSNPAATATCSAGNGVSGTYGQYDNGNNIFSFYDNFKGFNTILSVAGQNPGNTVDGLWNIKSGASNLDAYVNNGINLGGTGQGMQLYSIASFNSLNTVTDLFGTQTDSANNWDCMGLFTFSGSPSTCTGPPTTAIIFSTALSNSRTFYTYDNGVRSGGSLAGYNTNSLLSLYGSILAGLGTINYQTTYSSSSPYNPSNVIALKIGEMVISRNNYLQFARARISPPKRHPAFCKFWNHCRTNHLKHKSESFDLWTIHNSYS